MQVIHTIKTAKTRTQRKIDSRLFLALLHRRADARLAPLTTFRFVRPQADGRVAVDIAVASPGGIKSVNAKVIALGGVVRASSRAFRRVAARVSLESLEELAALEDVRWVRQAVPRRTQKVNTSEGDKTHGADEARSFFGVSGSGVKVCVLSDGVDSLTALEASGDLPPSVDVLAGQAGSGDEGSAMLEIVHDLAPGAALGFATADPDEATFAQNILDLATSGCNIIVDDVIYFDESPFEDGPVAQAVNTVTGAGVLYFSSAGNTGNQDAGTSATWEGDFNPNGTPAVLAGGGTAHNFGDGGQSISITSGADIPVALIWAEHYDLTTGEASTDFDLYDMDDSLSTIFDASTNTQDGTGGDDFPFEFIDDAFSGDRLVVMQFAAGTTSSVPMFNLTLFDASLDPALATAGATRGHNSAVDAFSVAATPAAESFEGLTMNGPYPGLFTAANQLEFFSSDGPRRIILSPTGAELTPGNRTSTGGVVRQKPDITAADGVSCAAPGFDPFYGTSAAAPHAAAIAALLKSAVPGLTQAQVRTALISSAIDIQTAGTDRDSGAGIVMAHAALAAVGATPQAFLTAGTAVPTQVIGDGDAFIEPNETWALAVPLTNAGGAGATALSAVLTSASPSVSIVAGSSAYPDLAAGATASNTTPFRFSLGPGATCGGMIQFTLTVTYTGGGSPQTFNVSLQTGAPGTPQTFSFTGPAVPIPDGLDDSGGHPGAQVFASLPISGVTGNIYDLNLRLDGSACTTTKGATTVGIDHSFVSDLQISLISPAATALLAINEVGGNGRNFCQTLLDDEGGGPAIQTVAPGMAPFTGTFTPNLPLAAFRGQPANGTWQLAAQDFFAQDTGNIRAFSLIVTPAICNAPVPAAAIISATKAVTGGDLADGGSVVYTIVLHNSGTGAQTDNAGNEFVDTLPADLTVGTPTATAGTVSGAGVNPVTWNGAIAPNASVTITIPATIHSGTAGHQVTNQGTVSYDSDGDGVNDATATTNDPQGGGATTFTVGAATQPIAQIPTLSPAGLAALGALLALIAVSLLRRRRSSQGAS